MKHYNKILLILFCAFVFAILYAFTISTAPISDTQKENNIQITKMVRATSYSNGVINFNIYHFNYNGHQYISFTSGYNMNGVVHDPDCECFKK